MAARSILHRTARGVLSIWHHSLLCMALAMGAISLNGCGGGGSDAVVAAEPIGAPATVVPPRTAVLSWDAVSHPDVTGYRVYYGKASGNYIQPAGHGIYVGSDTSYTATGLDPATRYYFVVTSVDAMGNESPVSQEVFKDIS